MPRQPDSEETKLIKEMVGRRLRELRMEFGSVDGLAALPARLNIPVRHWYYFERGRTVPAEVILRIIEATNVEPVWLLRGVGPKYRPSERSAPANRKRIAADVIREAIARLESRP
jgi:hypothetical protein